MDDLELRHHVYAALAATGRAPTLVELTSLAGSGAAGQLRRLHDRHLLVLDAEGEIAMALPFATRPGGHRVVAGSGAWWANCAWDSLAIPAALGIDATIEARWLDDDTPVDVAVRDGDLTSTDGWIHFAVPARHWWDDIVET